MHSDDKAARVLLVDDTASTLRQLGELLRANGYQVDEAECAATALQFVSKAASHSFVLLDQVLDGAVDGGTRAAAQISALRPDLFIVMYTADALIDEQRRLEALNSGAHRYIRKSSASELLRDFQAVIEDMTELQDLTQEINEIAVARSSMFSLLVGLDVRFSIIDREYRVWFPRASDQEALRCWTLFHGRRAQQRPCFGCLIKRVIESGVAQTRTLAVPAARGGLGWYRHDAVPIKRASGRPDRIMAVREATQKLAYDHLTSDTKERLDILAASIVHLGFGRARIYSASGVAGKERIRCDAVATRFTEDEDQEYRHEAMGFEIDVTQNVFMRRAIADRDGTLVEIVEGEAQPDASSLLRIRQEAPWIDIPIMRGSELIGWLAADMVGASASAMSRTDIDRLRPFKEEIASVLLGRSGSAEDEVARRIIAEAKAGLGSGPGEEEALSLIVDATHAIVKPFVDCSDIRIRVRQDGILRLVKRLRHTGRAVPTVIDEMAPDSLTAYVVRWRNDLFIDNFAEYNRQASANGRLPRGLGERRGHDGLAILQARLDEEIFGTLHIDCIGEIDWKESHLQTSLRELADMTALLLRDIAQNRERKKAKATAESQLAQAFGAIHGIKGPLQAGRNFLMSITELYQKRQLTLRKAVDLAQSATIALERIERLASRLLRLVREGPSEIGEVNVQTALKTCIVEAAVLHPELQVRFHLDEGIGTIFCDRAEFVMIVEELVMNSAHAQALRVEINVGVSRDHVVITVEDDGRGVTSDELLEKIFTRWYHEFPGGSGLGLALVRRVVQDLGGWVVAEHAQRSGLRIRIELPRWAKRNGTRVNGREEEASRPKGW